MSQESSTLVVKESSLEETEESARDPDEAVPHRYYYNDGMQATKIILGILTVLFQIVKTYKTQGPNLTDTSVLVFSKEDLDPEQRRRSFPPDLVHQIYGEHGFIYGYRNISIDIYYLANSARCYFNFQYTDLISDYTPYHLEIDDIMGKLMPWLPENYTTDKEEFLVAIKNEDNKKMFGKPLDTYQLHNVKEDKTYKYIITECSTEEEGFTEFHYRFQCLLVWFIDAASQIDMDDPNWMFLYVYEERTDELNSITGVYPVGFATVYKFFHFPDKIRTRISQFFIIPPCQGMGLGTHLLENTYKVIWNLPNVIDIAVEDPCPAFTRIRDQLDCKLLQQLKCFKEPNINQGFTNSMFLEANMQYKINKKQCQRIYDILRFTYIKCDRLSPEYAKIYNTINERFKLPFSREQLSLIKKTNFNPEIIIAHSKRHPLESIEKNIGFYINEVITVAQKLNKLEEDIKTS